MRTFFGIVLVLLCLVTWVVLRSLHDDRMDEAVRRIDDLVRTAFRDEEARSPSDYQPYPYLQQEAYSRGFQKLGKEEVKVPSPLLGNKPPYILLHFQVDEEGRFTSPQAPTGTAGEIAAAQGRVTEEQQREEQALLDQVARLIDRKTPAQNAVRGTWINGQLFYLRRTRNRLQGYWVDWPKLKRDLLRQAADLPGADLVPGERLLNLPADLTAQRAASYLRWTKTHTLLAGAWVFFVGIGLYLLRKHSSLARSQEAVIAAQSEQIEKERRFARHVTHELRGPLTTFQLYHELLDEGLVPEEKRAEYFKTLREESTRMGRLVGNVIAFADLERGRELQVERASLADAVKRSPRTAKAGVDIDLGDAADANIEVDSVAFGQIIENVLSNAERYGTPPIEIRARRTGPNIELRITDQGEGPDCDPFKAYERGRHEGTATRGLGLGMSIAQGMARKMGGDLTLEPPATFVLTLPLAN